MWPYRLVRTSSRYMVNGYRFATHEYATSMKTNNSGVYVKGISDGRAGDIGYYGVLHNIIQLEYNNPTLQHTRVVLFKCDWYDTTNDRGVKYYRKSSLVEVNVKRKYPKYEPFVLAAQAQQVYYCRYPGAKGNRKNWQAVVKVRPRNIYAMPEKERVVEQRTSFQSDEMHMPVREQNESNLPTIRRDSGENNEILEDDPNDIHGQLIIEQNEEEEHEEDEEEYEDETEDEEEYEDATEDDDDDDNGDDDDENSDEDAEY